MTRNMAILAVFAVSLFSPFMAHADLKWNDPGNTPQPFGSEGHVVTLTGPIPKGARVSQGNSDIFDKLNRKFGPVFPKDYPAIYRKRIRKIELFNEGIAWNINELHLWYKRHGFFPTDDVTAMFQRYVDEGYKIRLILMEHPEVPRLSSYSRCSVVLQRGIIIYEQGRETLYIRSYVHSANEGQDFVNFVPRTGVKFTFDSKMIWFPLETTAVIQEPASYVVIDILTPRPLKSKIAPPFRITRRGPVKLNNRKFQVTRINAKLAAKRTRDLRIKPQ